MEDEIKKVLTIEVNGDRTVKSLKEEINLLRDALLNVEQGSDNYKKILEKLIDDQKQLTSVMSAGKKEVTAAAGSYNALQQEMTALRKVWREVTDEASRAEIGQRILEINNQLKEMDASIGNFQRNVGDYRGAMVDASKTILSNLSQISPVLGSMGGQIKSLIPLIQKTTQAATTGLKGVKAAIASTGIGALIIALGLLAANWRKVTDAVIDHIPRLKEQKKAVEDITAATDAYVKSLQNLNAEIEFEATLMQIQGESEAEILSYKYQQTQALIEETKAQLENLKAAKAATLQNLTMWDTLKGRIFYGINYTEIYTEEIKKLEAELANLEKQSNSLFNQIRVNNFKVWNGLTGTTKATKTEKKALDERLTNIKKFQEEAKRLRESYYNEEQKITKTFADNTKTTMEGLYADVINLISNGNLESVDLNIVGKLKEALDTADFDKLSVQVETLFPDNQEIKAIVDDYKTLNKQVIEERKKAEKELYTERITKNAETLNAIREQEEKNVEDAINLQLRERNALRGDKANDRVQQLQDEQIAEQKIYEERIKSYQNFITLYTAIANDENATDKARKQAKADVAQAEIELQNLVTEKTIANMEKQKEVQEQQIANTKEMINDINEFASTIGDILGSISDYWMDYVEGQVKAGKMTKQEGERQFKWIKAMQIAQTTIQTLAAAMAAFNGITSSTGGWGIAAAAAEMAAVIATGAIQIAKIKATQLESESSNNLSAGAQVRTITTDFQPNYVAAQTGASETDNLANAVQQSPIYVNVVEIESLMDKRKVRTSESQW